MLKTVGSYGVGYAKAFDVSENTVKTWRRRGAVSLRYLEGFAREYGVSLDYLLYGNEQMAAAPAPLELSADEQVLIDGYRALDPATRKRLLAFVLGGEVTQPTKNKQVIHGNVSGQVAGRDMVNNEGAPRGRKKKE